MGENQGCGRHPRSQLCRAMVAQSGQPQPQGQKAKTKLLSFLSVEKISARHGTEGWRIGIGFLSQSQSPSQFRPAGEGLFFVSISDYYLPIIRTFSGEANSPG